MCALKWVKTCKIGVVWWRYVYASRRSVEQRPSKSDLDILTRQCGRPSARCGRTSRLWQWSTSTLTDKRGYECINGCSKENSERQYGPSVDPFLQTVWHAIRRQLANVPTADRSLRYLSRYEPVDPICRQRLWRYDRMALYRFHYYFWGLVVYSRERTRSSADADNRRDAFSGQSRSTNMAPFWVRCDFSLSNRLHASSNAMDTPNTAPSA